jgi:hypothetical protein
MRWSAIASPDVVVEVDGATYVPLVLPAGAVLGDMPGEVLGACAIWLEPDAAVPAVVLVLLGYAEGPDVPALKPDDDWPVDGAFIAPPGAGDVFCAVCEFVLPPEVESAELLPLDCA